MRKAIEMGGKDDNHQVIDALIGQWETPYVELAIFGTGKGQDIASQLSRFCQQALHSGIDTYLFYESSQGAVCGVVLDDGLHVVIKAHQPGRDLEFLQAVYTVQRYLAEHDYPCPLPLLPPTPLGAGYAIVETLIDEGSYQDAHIPWVRQTMAAYLARLAAFTPQLQDTPGLAATSIERKLPPGVLWPTPHSKIFDFEATAKGAEWIDELAWQAKAVLDQDRTKQVIGHSDYSVKHFRFVDKRVTVIYDWDSLTLEHETQTVAHAAIGFTMTWHLDVPLTPTPEEARAFIAEYEEARGKAFTAAEWQVMLAAATYSLAYGARCYHCLYQESTNFPPGTAIEALVRYKDKFLES